MSRSLRWIVLVAGVTGVIVATLGSFFFFFSIHQTRHELRAPTPTQEEVQSKLRRLDDSLTEAERDELRRLLEERLAETPA